MTKKSNRLGIASLVIFLPILLFSVQSFSASSPLKLGLNWKPEPQFGGFYAAELKGEFKKKKLEVQIQEGGSGTPTVQMLTTDKIEYGIVSAEELMIAHERNPKNKLVALFAVYQTNPQVIMAHKEHKFTELKEVFQADGLLALQSGLTYAQFLMKKFKPYKVKIVPYLGGIAPFIKDPNYSQQGFITSEPLLAEKAGLAVSTFLVAREGFNPYTTVLATQASRLKQNPEEVRGMIDAVRAGWESYMKDPEPTNKMMNGLNKSMDLNVMNASAKAQKELIVVSKQKLGEMSSSRWAELQAQLKDLGLLKDSPPPEEYFFQP